jgi:hypothetical protein
MSTAGATALYTAEHERIEIDRLRSALATTPTPRTDASSWPWM